jgi:Fic family protein
MITRGPSGRYAVQVFGEEQVKAFVPDPLPPTKPPFSLDGELTEKLQRAQEGLKVLALAGTLVPSLEWFIYAFVRKEAVLSSQIEGTQTTLIDLLSYEAEATSPFEISDPHLQEVCNYLDAVTYARQQMNAPTGLPLCMRLLNGAHSRLMKGVRGGEKAPGVVRHTQNWIGGTRPGNAMYVPPPPEVLTHLLSAFDVYIHSEDEIPALIRIGLLHVQFETIHPYLDGNGRIGRLLVTLLLEHWGLLPRPLLYLSLYFKKNRTEYYQKLSDVRKKGDWESWISFFLDGVSAVSDEACKTARVLSRQVAADRVALLNYQEVSVTALQLFEVLPQNPILTVGSSTRHLNTTIPRATRALKLLENAGILVELTGRKRNRQWSYKNYIDVLRRDTDDPNLSAGS